MEKQLISRLRDIRSRCNNKNHRSYRWYGAKNIKCLISLEELKIIWLRDRAGFLKKPSIDRIDPKGNYEFSNCRFIELEENCGRSTRGLKFVNTVILKEVKCKNCLVMFSVKTERHQKYCSMLCRVQMFRQNKRRELCKGTK